MSKIIWVSWFVFHQEKFLQHGREILPQMLLTVNSKCPPKTTAKFCNFPLILWWTFFTDDQWDPKYYIDGKKSRPQIFSQLALIITNMPSLIATKAARNKQTKSFCDASRENLLHLYRLSGLYQCSGSSQGRASGVCQPPGTWHHSLLKMSMSSDKGKS